uniref:Family with sequence similarity 210 member B n=1 Tax=Xiphophorus couchianus TaxID=32473 RepID=A0A3B5M4U3_9TELE
MQTRAASSSSATKRSEEQTDGSKAVINSVCLTQVGPNGFKSPHAAWFLCPAAERIHNFTIKYSESRKAVAPSAPWRQPSCNRAGLLYNFLYEEEKPNKTQQLKKVFKEYGAVGVSFHIGISLMSLGMFYLLISSGIDMTTLLCKLGFSEELVQSKMAAGTSTFVLAYAVHKLFAPVRISITVVSVPLIVRYFRKTGLFKPPTPAP